MKDQNDGLIKQLKNVDATTLTEKEIEFFSLVLDENYTIRLLMDIKKMVKPLLLMDH